MMKIAHGILDRYLIWEKASSLDGKPENDLGWKMVQVCQKENGLGFQN